MAFELYARFKEQMSTIILESEDIKTNPFLTGTFGKSLETFEKLRGTKNKRHEELIKTFLKSPCKSIDYCLLYTSPSPRDS